MNPADLTGTTGHDGLETYLGHRHYGAGGDHGYDFTGKRVAVLGTSTTTVRQVPQLATQVASLTVFERNPGWVLPRLAGANDRWVKAMLQRATGAQRSLAPRAIEALAKTHLRRQVQDRWLRRQLTPTAPVGAARVFMSSDYFPALQRQNSTLVTWPIVRMCPSGIRTADGLERRFDCVVFAADDDVPPGVLGLSRRTG